MLEMSGRKYMVFAFTTTYCLSIIGFAVLAILRVTPIEVFLGIFAGFTPMVALINDWYFKREDRGTTKKEGNNA